MADRYLNPVGGREAYAVVESMQTRQAARRLAMTPETAQRMASLAQRYPQMSAELVTGLGLAGIGGDHPSAQQAAELEQSSLQGSEVPGQWVPPRRKKRGLLQRAAGVVAGGVADVLDVTVRPVGEALYDDVLQPAARTVFTAMDTLQDELIDKPIRSVALAVDEALHEGAGGLSNVGEALVNLPGAYGRSGQSSGALALGDLLAGRRVDLGSGFFPGGDVGARAAESQSARLSGGGVPNLPGLVGLTFLEPGTEAYERLAAYGQLAQEILLDPAAWATAGASGYAKAARGFGVATKVAPGVRMAAKLDDAGHLRVGLVRGARNTILPEVVEAWARNTDEGRQLAQVLTESTDARDIYRSLRGGVHPNEAHALSQASSVDEVYDILLGQGARRGEIALLGERMRSGPKMSFRRETPRVLQLLPGSVIPTDDMHRGATELERLMTHVRMDDTAKADLFGRWAQLRDGDGAGALNVVTDLMKRVEDNLTENGWDRGAAKQVTKLFTEHNDDFTKYVADTMGDNPAAEAFRRSVVLGGETVDVDIRLLAETLQGGVPLPDLRELARATASPAVQKVTGSSAADMAMAANDKIMKAWAPLQLLRGAWTLKGIGEEQVRLAVAGLNSAFNHPLSWIAWAMGKRGDTNVFGDEFTEAAELDEVLASQRAGWMNTDAGRRGSGLFETVDPRVHERGREAWLFELRKLAADPIAQRVAGKFTKHDIGTLPPQVRGRWETMNDADRAKAWLSESAQGRTHLEAVASRLSTPTLTTNRAQADAYVDWVAAALNDKTGGSQDLVHAVRDGMLDGESLTSGEALGRSAGVRGRRLADGRIAGSVQTYADELLAPYIDFAPGEAAVDILLSTEKTSRYDHIVGVLFDTLMTRPTNYLSRAPAFRQFYWQRAEELAGVLDPESLSTLVKNAKGVVDKDMYKRLTALKSKGTMSLSDLDDVAKSFGLNETKKLLYDLSNNARWADATRGMFVFANAWQEIGTTWARLLVEKPQIARRAQVGIEGLRDTGIFYPDESTGEEMFAFPDPLGLFTSSTLGGDGGVRAVMQSPVRSLNLFSQSVIPGFGPVSQIAVSKLLPDRPDLDWLREFVLPFNRGDVETPGDLLDSALPAYMKKVINTVTEGGLDERAYGNARIDVQKAMLLTGDYSTDTPDGIARLWEDSKTQGGLVGLFRAGMQFLLPGAPTVKYEARDVDGQWWNFQALQEEYYALLAEAGGDHFDATKAFTDRFGFEPQPFAQGKTQSINKRAVTKPGAMWERKNEALVGRYPTVVGFFAPEDFDETFDFQAYLRAINNEDRATLTPEQHTLLANNAKGWMMYTHARDQLERAGAKGERAQAALKQVRGIVTQAYPGFGRTDMIGVHLRPKRENVIEQLQVAAADPALRDNTVARALRVYFGARDQLLADARNRGFESLGSDTLAGHRQALVAAGTLLAKQYPLFTNVWDEVLSGEVRDDINNTEVQRAA